MDDFEDVKTLVNKASKSVGTLKFICNYHNVSIDTKIKLFCTIPLFFLWGRDMVIKKILRKVNCSKTKLCA